MIIVISITLLFISLRLTVTLFNFISNPKLTRVNKPYNSSVSILVPVRNEENNIVATLESIARQDYKNYEVIIYEDESTDRTFEVCEAFCRLHAGFKVIKGDTLPQGWYGKNYACHQLAKLAQGDYLLFLDAGVILNLSLINSAVHRMQLYKLSLLSIFPDQIMKTFGERTTVPLMHYMLLNLLPVRLIHLSKSALFATACGQFMLFDADNYRDNEWHLQVKDSVIEDIEIMREIKAAGFSGEVLLANGMVKSRMYENYTDAINGFSKSLPAIFNYNILGMLVYILLLIGGPAIIITTLNFNLIFFMSGLILLGRVMISLAARQQTLYNMITHPIQMLNFMIIVFLSIQRHLTRSNYWKGRRLDC